VLDIIVQLATAKNTQQIGSPPHTENSVAVCNADVELVESFIYLESAQHRNGSSDTEIWR